MKRLTRWARNHPKIATGLVAGAAGGLVFVVVWFQPQKLFIDQTVAEDFPVVTTTVPPATTLPSTTTTITTTVPEPEPAGDAGTTTTTTTTTTVQAGPVLLGTGEFIELGHPGSGTASLYQLEDGSHIVRFEGLDVSNGPDLRVILSSSPLVGDRGAYDDGDFVDLGDLKGNVGDQNYAVPAGIDLEQYPTVAIWCRRFNYSFNAAPLDPPV